MNKDTITIIISSITALVSITTLIVSVLKSVKNQYTNIVTKERLDWADHLRNAISNYIEAYYLKRDLSEYRDKILIYLNTATNRPNSNHTNFAETLNAVTSGEKTIDDLIVETQKILNWNWRAVKKETSTLKESENAK